MLLSYYLTIGRETVDIDLLARRLNAEKSNVELIMQEICLINLDDGFQMQFINLDDLDHQHMNYPGFQIGIAVQFGVMSDKFFVDIGVGDVVEPVLLEWPSFNYKEKPLFEDLISLEVYPVETIFAEKLETLIISLKAGTCSKQKLVVLPLTDTIQKILLEPSCLMPE